jgi:sigma-B regulation protein RsbU (phosphoserine phosphatase)
MEPAPAQMLTAVNYSLVERLFDAQFVSLIYGICDDANLTLQVENSGLPRPVYCHKGKTQMIEATGLPLGLFEDAEYDEFVFQAEPDDIFVFFSDGILDATNRAGDLFGRTRLEKIIADCSSQPAESIVKSIFKAARDHASGVETFDDQTVVAIKVKGSTPPRT